MRAFPRKGPLNTRAGHASTHHPEAQLREPHQYSIILLGVMYPGSVALRHLQNDEPTLPPEKLINRRSTDVIFYDPISANNMWNPDQSSRFPRTPERSLRSGRLKENVGTSCSDRGASSEAVARDLALLFLRKRT